MINKFLLFALFITQTSFASMSAHRNPKLPFAYYEELMLKIEKEAPTSNSAIASARYYTGQDLASPTSWDGLDSLLSRFQNVRDERHLKWTRQSDFSRRISWLYPYDGCYARTTSTNNWFKKHDISVPSNVFAFGRLKVKTNFSYEGAVYWWFHAAPVVEVGGEKYVIDPSIEAARPLPLGDWLARMGTPASIKVAICGPGATSPNSSCSSQWVGPSPDQNYFLNLEWDQLMRLKKNPESLLGETPPWMTSESELGQPAAASSSR